MARRNEVEEVEGNAQGEAVTPSTIGALFPGLPVTVAGVNVHALPVGLLVDFIVGGVEAEVAKSEAGAARGVSPKDDAEQHTFLKNTGRSVALAAFAQGLLPSAVEDKDDYIRKAAVNYVRADIAAKARASGNSDEFEAAWFDARFSDEEREQADAPRSHSRANCIKRVAGAWLAKTDLPDAAQAIRDRVVAEGEKAHADTLAAAQARVARAAVTLFNPLATPEPVAVVPVEDAGF